jgi:hypothetical protein
VVSNTYCVVFLFLFSSSGVPYDASSSGLSFLISRSVFSNVYSLEIIISKTNIGYDSAILIVFVPSGVPSSFEV